MLYSRLIVLEQFQRIGWPGFCGALLLLLALLLMLPLVLPGSRVVLPSQHDALVVAPVTDNGAQELERFHLALPGQQDAALVIQRIYDLAGHQSIALASGEYALASEPGSRLARYQIMLPVRGSYPQIRRFIHAILADIPALALEDVDLQRRQVNDSQLDGRIRMTLYLAR